MRVIRLDKFLKLSQLVKRRTASGESNPTRILGKEAQAGIKIPRLA